MKLKVKQGLNSWIAHIVLVFLSIQLLPETLAVREPKQKGFTSNATTVAECSRDDILAGKIEVCAKPLMDILEGTLERWPQVENDIESLCGQFHEAERCIRSNGRKCGIGLQKIIISTVANSIQRTRKRECSKQKYSSFLRLTKCIENNRPLIQLLITNATSQLGVVEQMKDLDRRTTAVCCTINNMESEMARLFKPICPNETVIVLRLFRSIVEDVLELICVNPKCHNPFEGYKLPIIDMERVKQNIELGGIISFMVRIIFSLGAKST